MEKVVVGLSGGIDSFMTAFLLKKQGYEVVGMHLLLWDDKREEVNALGRLLNIEVLSFDAQDYFREQVVRRFVDEYSLGQTPNPCALCNNQVKWHLLEQVADSLNIRKIATGHYVRILTFDNHLYIHRGIDVAKDQSYFLWGVGASTLDRTLTPLGNYTKIQVRQMAIDAGFVEVERKRESMGICFIGRGDYRTFVEQQGGCRAESGEIVDRMGRVIGRHVGLPFYTIGQKRDMPLLDGQPLYVAEIDAERNRIVADRKSGLFSFSFYVEEFRFINPKEITASDIVVLVRGVGLNPEGFARLQREGNGLRVNLDSPAWAMASGQPVAFYRGDRLIGGGIYRKKE